MAGAHGDANHRSAGVKRLLKEAKELHKPTSLFYARPLDDNLFEWHFTVRGPADSDYANGVYHGRIVCPHEYPMKPPNIYLLTENGRFETNTKICLSISGYHPETWLPSWSIRTALLALIAFFPTDGAGAVGSIDCSKEVRQRLARKSLEFTCKTCQCSVRNVLPENDNDAAINKEDTTLDAEMTTPNDASPLEIETLIVTPPELSAASTSERATLPIASSTLQTPFYVYGICIAACFIAFLALLVRRLNL